MDIALLALIVLLAAAGLVLLLARGAPPDEGDAAAVVAALLGAEPLSSRAPEVRDEEDHVRWRVDLARPRGSTAGGLTTPRDSSTRRPSRQPIGDIARLGR